MARRRLSRDSDAEPSPSDDTALTIIGCFMSLPAFGIVAIGTILIGGFEEEPTGIVGVAWGMLGWLWLPVSLVAALTLVFMGTALVVIPAGGLLEVLRLRDLSQAVYAFGWLPVSLAIAVGTVTVMSAFHRDVIASALLGAETALSSAAAFLGPGMSELVLVATIALVFIGLILRWSRQDRQAR
jgi:hypothetical protein